MMLKHALATGAATLSMAAGGLLMGAQPADAAAPAAGTSKAGLTGTYRLTTPFGAVSGRFGATA